jgi:pimeloyl-ACP methyl ester carboxylesterase
MIEPIHVTLLLGLAALLMLVLTIVLPLARRGRPGQGAGREKPTPDSQPAKAGAHHARHDARHDARQAGPARSQARMRAAGVRHHRTGHSSQAAHHGAADAKPSAKKRDTATALAIVTALGGAFGLISWLEGAWGDEEPPAPVEITAGALHGTLLAKDPSDPLLLIIPGSGPTDRDGNSPMGVSAGYLKMLADELVRDDIATVRIDKRGMFASQTAGDPSAVTPAIYAGDIHAWIEAIKAERGPDAGCIFLAGHSEGALMASIAAQGRSDVCGVILLAGMGRPLGEIIRAQLAADQANAPLMNEATRALEALEAGQRVDTNGMHPALLGLFNSPAQDYLISLLRIDPVEELRKADTPALIIQGARDLQVSEEDARRLAAAPGAELTLIPGMNHVLKDAPGDRAGNLATYADPSQPLSDELVDRIRRFVKDND